MLWIKFISFLNILQTIPHNGNAYNGRKQGRTDHLETQAVPEGPGSVGGPMRCPWYLLHRLF
ncbi:unnamed protein product [Staurois parvus]|uniref:Uncharacterized protein n=1 Tax=Staurois parvus TaxID=386267 RepID=A0ABN9D1Y0_9NEOB|nr:unnamed protein product [Staurois parvus]